MEMIVKCVFPKSMGGEGASAILIDSDAKFNAERMARVLAARLQRIRQEYVSSIDTGSLADVDIESFVEQCMRRLHIVR